jgi:hypothetical protein
VADGKRQRQKIIGHYPAAAAAKLRKELELRKSCNKASSNVAPEESMKLDAAIETFLHERENLNPDSARRWRIEPDPPYISAPNACRRSFFRFIYWPVWGPAAQCSHPSLWSAHFRPRSVSPAFRSLTTYRMQFSAALRRY